MKRSIQSFLIFILALSVSLVFSASAGATDTQSSPPEAASVPPKPKGILPLPDYSGDFFKRAYLLGDFGGKRSEWAKKGITFNIDYYQYFQSVVDGGVETSSHYGGVIDFNLAIDFDRMGVIPGGLLQMRAVSRYGRSVNGITGSLMPVNTNATTPTTSEADEDVFFYLPVIYYTHFFGEKFGAFFGKINTYDQVNEFSGGSGKSQFMNINFAFPISPSLFVPYSILAVGGFYMPTPNLTIKSLVGTSEDTSNHSGFGFLDDGKWALLEVTYKYQIKNLPGGLINEFGYGWDNDFTEIKGPINIGPGGLTPASTSHSWWNSSSIWQYLWVEDKVNTKVDTANGRQDLQGVGFFARYQFADEDTNPIDYLFSIGLSGKGLVPNRDNDTMGLAYNYGKLLETRLGNIAGVNESTYVWELYYNVELTPAIHLNLDAQVVDGAIPDADTATILGAQLELRF